MGRYLNIHLLRSYLHLCATLLPHGVFHTASVCMGIGQKQACHAPSADKGRGMGFEADRRLRWTRSQVKTNLSHASMDPFPRVHLQ